MEAHLTFYLYFFYSACENLTTKVIFYVRSVITHSLLSSVMETRLWWGNAHVSSDWFECSRKHLAPIGRKPR
jgi:hypothetical protein